MNDSFLVRHLISHDYAGRLLYRFPNGEEVSVIPDPTRPLRWEIKADSADTTESGLTSAEAEARLAELANAPMPEWDGPAR
jgi:hypothetical protein